MLMGWVGGGGGGGNGVFVVFLLADCEKRDVITSLYTDRVAGCLLFRDTFNK